MNVEISVSMNISVVEERLKASADRALTIVTEQALKDCNYYCKQDQSGLINSSLIHSEPQKGLMRWKTPYARRQYYLNSVRRDINPNARKMWAHYAESIHGNDWLKAMQQLFSRYAKEGR